MLILMIDSNFYLFWWNYISFLRIVITVLTRSVCFAYQNSCNLHLKDDVFVQTYTVVFSLFTRIMLTVIFFKIDLGIL